MRRVLVGLVAAALGTAACAARDPPARSPAGATPNAGVAPGGRFASEELDYEWRRGADWELMPAEALELADASLVREVVAARPRFGSDDRALLAVSELAGPIPTEADAAAASPAGLEAYGAAWLAARKIAPTATRRTTFLDHEAVRLDARFGHDPEQFLALVLFAHDGRRFEVRCLTTRPPSDPPCASAFAALTIHEHAPPTAPRPLHLREPRFGLSFDAPDDEWLAVGPRASGGGRSRTWTWSKEGRRIVVSIVDLTGKVAITLDDFVRLTAAKVRASGATVEVSSGTRAGRPVGRLDVERGTSGHEEAFLERRGNLVFALHVSTPAPEPELVERALAGLRIDDATP